MVCLDSNRTKLRFILLRHPYRHGFNKCAAYVVLLVHDYEVSSTHRVYLNIILTTNKMQLCRISLLFPCFLAALHVSSDVIAQHQEHLNCSYSFWFYSRVSLSASVMAEKELVPTQP